MTILLSSFDKVTTGTYNFVSLIINTALPASVDNTHYFFCHVRFNLILQLIKGISNDLKKLLKYFNGTTIFKFLFTIQLVTTGLPNKLTLYLKDAELLAVKSTLLSGGSSIKLIKCG